MCFVGAVNSIDILIFPSLDLSQENWSILAVEDSCVILVGKVDNILHALNLCDSLKQSIKLIICGAFQDVILFS
jgi:hypothetical protein